jgi:hypothetical protein
MSKVNSIAFAVLTVFAAACGSDDPITAFDRASDCRNICNSYKECIAEDYNVDSCADDCNDMVSEEDTDQIDDCQDCLKGNSCVESVFQCTTECAGIIP